MKRHTIINFENFILNSFQFYNINTNSSFTALVGISSENFVKLCLLLSDSWQHSQLFSRYDELKTSKAKKGDWTSQLPCHSNRSVPPIQLFRNLFGIFYIYVTKTFSFDSIRYIVQCFNPPHYTVQFNSISQSFPFYYGVNERSHGESFGIEH